MTYTSSPLFCASLPVAAETSSMYDSSSRGVYLCTCIHLIVSGTFGRAV